MLILNIQPIVIVFLNYRVFRGIIWAKILLFNLLDIYYMLSKFISFYVDNLQVRCQFLPKINDENLLVVVI